MSVVKNLAHILFTGPLLIYVGLKQPEWVWIYRLLFAMGVLLAVYFVYLIVTLNKSPYHVWLAIHLVLFFPLLIWVGWKGPEAPKIAFSLLLAVGIAAFGYHLVRLFQAIHA